MHIDLATDDLDEATAAAITAAIACVLAEEAVIGVAPPPQRPAWRTAALLEAHGAQAARATQATWLTAARAARARRW